MKGVIFRVFLIFLGSIILCGCRGISGKSKTSFYAVTDQLDGGGNFYLYMDMTQLAHRMEISIDFFNDTLSKSADLSTSDKKEAKQISQLLKSSLKESGLRQFSGLGMSSVALSEKVYHNKVYFYRDPSLAPRSNARFWTLFGNKPHKLGALEMLPEETVMAVFFDIDADSMRNWLNSEVFKSKIPDLQGEYAATKEDFRQKLGVSIGKLIRGFDNHVGMFITFDRKNKNIIPFDGQLVKIPEPCLALVAKVKNKELFDFIFSQLKTRFPKITSYVNNGISIINVPLPPLPMLIQPVIAQKDGFLLITNNMAVANRFFSENRSEKLVAGKEFKALVDNIPLRGNGFHFVSSRISRLLQDIQKQLIKEGNQYSAGEVAILRKFNLFNDEFCMFAVYRVDSDGILTTVNSSVSISQLIVMQSSILPSLIVPDLLSAEAREDSDSSRGKVE